MTSKSQKNVVDKCYQLLEHEVNKMKIPDSAVKRVYLRFLRNKVEKELTPEQYTKKLQDEGVREIGKVNAPKSSVKQNALVSLNKQLTPRNKYIEDIVSKKNLSPIKESQSPKRNSPVKSPNKSPKNSPVRNTPRTPKKSLLSN
jgi:hypothetical protein